MRSSLNWFTVIAAHLDEKLGLWVSSGDLPSSKSCEASRVHFADYIKYDLVEMWNYILHKDDKIPPYFSDLAKKVMKFRKEQATKDPEYFSFFLNMLTSEVEQEI